MKNNLIKGDVPFRAEKSSHRRGFAVLGGMAAALCGVVIGGYMFMRSNDMLQPPRINDGGGELAGESGIIVADSYSYGISPDNPTFATVFNTQDESIGRIIITPPAAPAPITSRAEREFWYNETRGEDYILNIHNSLIYHAEFEDFSRRYVPPEPITERTIYTTEQFTFDFLEYVAMPLVLIPEPAPYYDGEIISKEAIRQTEINSTIVALRIARAFAEGDTNELAQLFYSNTPGLFDFVKNTQFHELSLIGSEFDPVTREHLHYFVISTDEDDGIFAQSNEWVMRVETGYQVSMFAPYGKEIDRIRPYSPEEHHDELVNFCYWYSRSYLLRPEMNLRGLFSFTHLGYEYTNYNGMGIGYFPADEFIELVDYVYGIEIDLEAIIEEQMFWEGADGEIQVLNYQNTFYPDGPLVRAELIESNRRRDGTAGVTMSFYGDAGYMFLAETLQFEFTAGQLGWRLVSTETIYDNPEVNVAFIHD